MKKYHIIILIALLVVFASTDIRARSTAKDSIPKKIEIIGDKFFPPYELEGENGEPSGFAVDLMKEVMKRLHCQYTIKLYPRKTIITKARTGHGDIILGMTYTNERAKFLKFGLVYDYAFKDASFRNDEKPITLFEHFKGKRVAVEYHSYAETLLKKAKFPVVIVPVKNLVDAFTMLNSHQVDAVLCNHAVAVYIIEKGNFKNISHADIKLPLEKYCLCGTNEELLTKINFVVYDLKREGVYDKLYDKWFHEDKTTFYKRIILVGLLSTGILVIICLAFFILLNYRVKKAKAQLERNQRNLDISLHAGQIGIWGYDVEKRLFVNVFCDYFPPDGRSFDDELKMIHPNDIPLFSESILSAASGNPPEKPICVRMDHKGHQNWKYIENEIHAIYNADNQVVKVIGTHKDITENINQAKQLSELLDDYEVIFNHTSIGAQCFDGDGNLIRINDAACRIFGVADKQAVLESKINIFDNPYFKGHFDREHLKETHLIVEDDFDKHVHNPQFNTLSLHGIHHLDTYISPVFDADGKLKRIIVNNNDITESVTLRQTLEEYAFKMKYILKTSGVMTWVYNPDTHTNTLSGEMEDKIQDMSGGELINNVSESDRELVADCVHKMDNREIDTFSIKVEFKRVFDSEGQFFFTVEGTPYRDKENKILYYIGLGINITDLIETQNKLKHEKEEAQKADRLKSAFLANVSHEIRTPLNSIVGFSELLQETEDIKDRKQFMEIIKTNNERLLTIINDVLDLSKIESGIMKLEIKTVDIEKIFSETYSDFSRQLTNSNVKLYYDSDNVSCIIDTDRTRFTQVLINFMTNAVKYTHMGFIRMGYSCEETGGIRIFVQDSGAGIPNDKKDLIFERFEKLNSFIQGTGLGLSICKDIAEMFNGKIGVESEIGKGSTFWMWIPCKCKITKKAAS